MTEVTIPNVALVHELLYYSMDKTETAIMTAIKSGLSDIDELKVFIFPGLRGDPDIALERLYRRGIVARTAYHLAVLI